MTEIPPLSSDLTDTPTRVDARGLRCPMPLLRAKQALAKLPAGAQLEVLATDAGSVRDFQAFTRLAGHRLLAITDAEGVYTYLIEKA